MTKNTLKKLVLTVLAATVFWGMTNLALAAFTLDDFMKPDSLPTIDIVEDQTDGENPETAATQTAILYVGGIIAQILLFVGALAVIFLIIAGANYILAFGKDERIERGKRGIFWGLIGLLVIMLSYAIVQGLLSVILRLDYGAT